MSQRLEDYEVLSIIGRGSSCTCYKVRNKFSKELYAWKAVDYGNLTEDQKQMLVSEVNLLRSLVHPNIVKYCGRILHRETTTLYIITEWCEGGDLSQVIKIAKDNGKSLDEQFIWRMLYQISRAIQVCHSRMQNFTIFHRDIKPANVFLDREGNAKLGDFGVARIVQPQKEFSETVVGTPYYMSPEIIKGCKYNRKSDIWALGCLIYELCALTPPFGGASMLELADTIKSGKYKSIPSQYSDSMKKIISFMLSTKHVFRPTIEMILHHPTVVMNIKKDYDIRSQSARSNFEDEVYGNLESDLVDKTLVDPEHISHKVFKEKWVEKQEALKEKEAWLSKREKNIGYKERSLASREKHLELLERQARQKQFLANLQFHKRKEKSAHENGHETDISVEPGDTPIRPTSAKLNPVLLPKPKILINACKKLEKANVANTKESTKYDARHSAVNKEPSNVRRSLLLHNSLKITEIKNKPDMLEETANRAKCMKQDVSKLTMEYPKNNQTLSSCSQQEQRARRHCEVMKEIRTNQNFTVNEIVSKLSTLNLTHDDRLNKQYTVQTKKRRKLKYINSDQNVINKENILEII